MTQNTDNIYASAHDKVSGFTFDDSVVSVFPDMIQRSVPGYSTIIHMIGQIAERYASSNSNLYDLGCSLGAATLSMRHRIKSANTRIIAIDSSQDMLQQCRAVVKADSGMIPVDLIHGDILNAEISNASVCVLNFTLQFIAIDQRFQILKSIQEGMTPGGALILSEKIAFEDPEHQNLMTELHHNFKRSNGYSDLEIAQKRTALEDVLIPETLRTHKARLRQAGFDAVDCWFQCFNFASLIAFKSKPKINTHD